MKKKILMLILSAAMVITMMPSIAFAEITLPDAGGTDVTFNVANDAELAEVVDILCNTDNAQYNTYKGKTITVQLGAGTFSGTYNIKQFPIWNYNGGSPDSPSAINTSGDGQVNSNINRAWEDKDTTAITFKGAANNQTIFTGEFRVYGSGNCNDGNDFARKADSVQHTYFTGINFKHDTESSVMPIQLYAQSSSIKIDKCNFENIDRILIGNSQKAGGYGLEVSITNCDFTKCDTVASGYAFYPTLLDNLNITNCNAVLNMQNGNGYATISNCNIKGLKNYVVRTDNQNHTVIVKDSKIHFATSAVASDKKSPFLTAIRGINGVVTFKNCELDSNLHFAFKSDYSLGTGVITVDKDCTGFTDWDKIPYQDATTTENAEKNKVVIEVPVAKIGNTTFTTLSAAFKAAKDGDEIDLLKDITNSGTYAAFLQNKKVTLDLNGKNIDGNNAYAPIIVGSGADLTIKDSVGGGVISNSKSSGYAGVFMQQGGKTTLESGKIYCESTSLYGVYVSGGSQLTVNGGEIYGGYCGAFCTNDTESSRNKVTVNDGKVKSAYYGIALFDYSQAIINDGLVEATEGHGLINNGSYTYDSLMQINGGTIKGGTGGEGVYHAGPGTITVKDGTVIGLTGIEIRAGNINVSGGEITGTYKPSEEEANDNGPTTAGVGIAVAQHTTQLPINVNITGGKINGYIAFNISNPQNNPKEATDKINVSVAGGQFKAINDGTTAIYSFDGVKNFITDGFFSSEPAQKYIAEGYATIHNDGKLVSKITYPWTIGHKVVFDSNGGSAVDTQELRHLDYVTVPKTPTKTDNTFAGWFKEDGTQFLFDSTPVTENITLKAHWVDYSKTEGDVIVEKKETATIQSTAKINKTAVPLTETEINAINTSEENEVKVVLDVEKVITPQSEAPEQDEELIQETIKDNKLKHGTYLDITMMKALYVNGEKQGESTAIHETLEPVQITVVVPENLRVNGRTYTIIRCHEGETEILFKGKANDKWEITFETDKFSTYAIAFSDSVIDTGDSSMLVLYAGVALLTLLGIAVMLLKKRAISR